MAAELFVDPVGAETTEQQNAHLRAVFHAPHACWQRELAYKQMKWQADDTSKQAGECVLPLISEIHARYDHALT